MLKRIHIDNYKCLTNFDLRFGDLTLLLGVNGCGKSAVFEVVGNCVTLFAAMHGSMSCFPLLVSRTGAKS